MSSLLRLAEDGSSLTSVLTTVEVEVAALVGIERVMGRARLRSERMHEVGRARWEG